MRILFLSATWRGNEGIVSLFLYHSIMLFNSVFSAMKCNFLVQIFHFFRHGYTLCLLSFRSNIIDLKLYIKVRTFWETHKIWKNLPHGFDKSADLLSKFQNHEEDFFKSCALLKKSELYIASWNSNVNWRFLFLKSSCSWRNSIVVFVSFNNIYGPQNVILFFSSMI